MSTTGRRIEVTYMLRHDVMEWYQAEQRRREAELGRRVEIGEIVEELLTRWPRPISTARRKRMAFGRRVTPSTIVNELALRAMGKL